MTSDAAHTSGPSSVPPTGAPGDTTTQPAKPHKSLKTRTGYTWVALVAAAVLGILLLVFILQNLDRQTVHLFFWEFSAPLGVTLLLSVIAGTLVMALIGGWRIMQLRRAAKRN